MVQASYSQNSFMSGEWSQAMQGRADHPEYRKALSVCFNSLPTETEAWTRRPGTVVAGLTAGGAPAKIIKFDFKESSPYNMEITDGALRFWQGATRVTANDSQFIISTTLSNPVVMQTQQPHGWATGDELYFTGLGTSAPLLQGRTFKATVVDSTHVSIADAVTGVAIDGATIGFITPFTANRITTIVTPYLAGSWRNLRAVQAEKQAIFLNGARPQILTLNASPGATSFATFALAPSDFKDGPYLNPYKGSLATPSALLGNITLTLTFTAYDATVSYSVGDYVTSAGVNYKSLQGSNLNNTPAGSPAFWQVVSGGDPISPQGLVPSDVNRLVRLFSEPPLWASGTAYAVGNIVAYGVLYYIATATSTGVIPGSDATKWSIASNVAVWTWGRILSVSGSGIIAGATGTPIGDMTVGGGVAAAFDGVLAKAAASCAESSLAGPPPGGTVFAFVGKNYSGGGGQKIAQATVYPSSDLGFRLAVPGFTTLTLNLRAKQSAPINSADGTLLGTTGSFTNQFTSVSIASNDQATTWNFVWVEIVFQIGFQTPTGAIAQAVFYTPNVNNGSVATVQIAGRPLLYTSPIRTWRLGVYSDTTGWPKCGTFHEGRLWLSGSVNNRFDASVGNDIFNFSPTDETGAVGDNNGISYVLNAPAVNSIFWMAPRQEGIVCGTEAGEFLVQATTVGQKLTPTNIQAHQYTSIKCANIEPAQCEHTLTFVQKHKRRVMEYFADVFSGKFSAPNLTYKSAHLTDKGIAEIRYQQDTMPVIWMRSADNVLSGITYKRDSLMSRDGPTLCAHHRHALGSNRSVESMAVGPTGDSGELESLSMITSDGLLRYVEIMGQLFDETDAASTAQFLDSALVPTSYVDTGTGLTLNGLWLLNGQTVSVFAGGLDCGTFTVANGSVTVPYGDGITGGTAGGQFTETFVLSFAPLMPILVGFSYLSQGQILTPDSPQESGTRQGPAFGKVKRQHRVVARVVNAVSNYLSFGTTFTKLKPALFRKPNSPVITTLFSGIYKETLSDAGDPLDNQLAWQATGPFPCTVSRVGGFIDTEDE